MKKWHKMLVIAVIIACLSGLGYFVYGYIDIDGDGLNNNEEKKHKTDPYDKDTDGDSLKDGTEIDYDTDPKNPDTDGDTLSDYDEIYIYHTNATLSDTSGDGISDGKAIELGLDPTKQNLVEAYALKNNLSKNIIKLLSPLEYNNDSIAFVDYISTLSEENQLALTKAFLKDRVFSYEEADQIKFLSRRKFPGLEEAIDTDYDKDGLDNNFEDINSLYDLNTPNDRFVILVGVYWNTNNPYYCKGMYKSQYEFFNKILKIPEENIINLVHENATYKNFVKACNEISKKVDNNDFVFICLLGHGVSGCFDFYDRRFHYKEIDKNLDKISSAKAIYLQINACYSGSALEYVKKGPCPRVILTGTDNNASGSFVLFKGVYPSILTKSADINKDEYVSIKESFKFILPFFSQRYPDLNLHPQLKDLNGISNKLYLGDVRADKTFEEASSKVFYPLYH